MCPHRQLKTLPLYCLTFPYGRRGQALGASDRPASIWVCTLCACNSPWTLIFLWSASGFFITVHTYLFLIATSNE